VTHDERLIESPVAHCALWIDADALLESVTIGRNTCFQKGIKSDFPISPAY
jgi:hypothetical protein